MNKFYILICLLLLVGCATMQLETNSKLTRTIVIDHSQLTNKTIYLQVTNTANSGGEKMNLNENIINSFKAKGYEIVDSSQKASYSLFVNVLFANNLKEARAIQAAAVGGVFGGVGALASGSNGSNSLIVGATAALAGGLIGKALEDETFRTVIDIQVVNNLNNSNENTRVYCEAIKTDLDLNEAMPILEKEATKSIVNIF
ncbi:MAG: complement resistance protein TraT [Campylobacterales bacterium]|nr:complement resistance protein TraT [Campylobacterales bacterium]